MNTDRTVKLIPPNVSLEHIKEKITCIRAHRERIFCVSTQILGGKLLCHNYGQGGAGWTFLFGCVHESIRQFEQQLQENSFFKNKPIAVIGAGCYGLLTAIILARKGYQVTIIAEDVDALSSYKAAGFFFPRARKSSTAHEREIFQARGIESYGAYQQIVRGTHPFIKAGPTVLPAYYGCDIDPGFKPYSEQGLISEPEKVVIDFGNGKIYHAMEYQTVFINSLLMMQELHRNISELTITITKATITSFNEVSQPIIFNCAGLGAQKLTDDKRIVPVQGHLITLKNQPSMEHLQYMVNYKVTMNDLGRLRDELIYFAPKESGILGITFMRGQASLTANQHEFDRLIKRCQDFFGSNV